MSATTSPEQGSPAPSTPPQTPDLDPPKPLPVRPVVIGLGLVMVVHTLAVAGLASIYGWSADDANGAIAGGIVATVSVLASLLALQPWKPRPMAMWTILWLGSSTIRLLFTPVALFSVYFATLLPGTAVLLGGTAAFLVALAVETVVIARAVHQSTSAHEALRRASSGPQS
jgi:hypothetical protein